MIRHILKIIWNERKTNAWIVLEFIIVFCILWFCIDYMYSLGKTWLEPQGADIKHVYVLEMKVEDSKQEITDKEARYEAANTILNRIRQYPGVESVCISKAAMPYSWMSMSSSMYVNNDTTYVPVEIRYVSPEFFDVFGIKLISGTFHEFWNEANKNIIISPNRYGMFGSSTEVVYPVKDVQTIIHNREDDSPVYKVAGIIEKTKIAFDKPFASAIYFPLERNETDPAGSNNEIAFRVTPEADHEFEKIFLRDMQDQLTVGPYRLSEIRPLEQRKQGNFSWYVRNNLKSLMAVSIFLIANIFLGIIGTFWSKIQSRRSEIGLRIALGSSKRKVHQMLYFETFAMLFVSSLVATYISINLGQTDFLQALGIPAANREIAGIGSEQELINYLLTFLLLAAISALAVWYPARLSTNAAPADTLREE